MTDTLTKCCSELLRLAEAEAWGYEEATGYHAPGECFTDISNGYCRQRREVLRQHGFTTVREFEDAFFSRVGRGRTEDGRWRVSYRMWNLSLDLLGSLAHEEV